MKYESPSLSARQRTGYFLMGSMMALSQPTVLALIGWLAWWAWSTSIALAIVVAVVGLLVIWSVLSPVFIFASALVASACDCPMEGMPENVSFAGIVIHCFTMAFTGKPLWGI
ncbi:MAG: hypothetical protein IT461_17170 [Planctomycetes bacterium]|nr:hypothetical protein [Planctomycetota bacterium]